MAKQPIPDYIEMRVRIARAFRRFRKNGGLAKMGFMCCRSCASQALYCIAREHGLKKVAFWCKQTDANSRKTGLIHVSYFHTSGRSKDAVTVATELAEEFRSCGLKVEWNGEANTTILVKGLKRK